MNAYTFHISPYDLAFLGTIFVGLTFALQLWFTKRINQTANRFLSLALAIMVLWVAWVLGIDLRLTTVFPHWSQLPLQFSLALGPLIYFYVLKITRPQYKFRWKDLLHFSPLLVEQGVLALEIKESIKTGAATYDTFTFHYVNPVLQLLAFFSVIIYLYYSFRLIDHFYRRQKFNAVSDRYRHELRWLYNLLTGFGAIWLLWIPFTAADYYYQLGRHVYYPLYLFLAVMAIWMAVTAFLKPEISAPPNPSPALKPSPPAELKQKGIWLKKAVEANRYYQDPELSLSLLAERLELTTHELSRIINTALKKSFNDFINEYRVAELIRRMQDPANDHLTLLGLAYDSGFNSKTSYNRIFKQLTGKNPVDYKAELKKEAPSYSLGLHRSRAAVISYRQTAPKWADTKLNRNYMFRNYLKIAWRSISRNKVYTSINVLGLSLGVCACLIIYLITSFELSYDTFHPDKDRIYRLVTLMQDPQGNKSEGSSGIMALPMTARKELSGFEDATGFYNYFAKVTVPGINGAAKKFFAPKEGEETSPVIVAEPQYFKIFQYKWLRGDPSTALSEPFKVVLSQQEVHKYFGTTPLQDVVGKEVIYNDSLRLTVSGVVEDWDKHTDFGFKDFISFATVQHSFLKNDIDLQSWRMWDSDSQGYVKLAKGVTQAQVEKQFQQFVKAHIRVEAGSKVQMLLQPLSDIHFNNHYPDSYSRQAHLPTLYGLMAIAVFILLIAAINFINLSTAQSLRRAKEVGVRKVLGSSKSNLTIQFLVETFIVTAIALVIAVAAVSPIISAFHTFIPQGVALNLFSAPVLLFLGAILIITALLAGFYPGMVLSSYLPALSLKGESTSPSSRKSYLRKTLIVFQFTVSLVFIIGALVVGDQIRFVLNKDLGFNKDAIITVHTNGNGAKDQLNVFCNGVRELPNVKMVSRHHATPAAQRHSGTFIEYKGVGGAKIDASFDFCDENYVPLFGLKIIAGRNLSHSDTLKEYLLNETCAKALGFSKPADAVGKTVEMGMSDSKRQVVGVVKDFHSKSLHEVITPFFMGTLKGRERTVSIKLAPGKGAGGFKTTIAQVEKTWKKVYPNEKFEYAFLDQTIAGFYDKEQKTAQLMNTAMLIAIFISCMGLFGLATFTAQQRVKEIGIRKVLGASVTNIVSMLSKDFLVLVIIAFLIASPIAFYLMYTWLQDFAYRVYISLWIFLLSGLSAIIIAFATVSFQAIKAALANPVKSLRSE
ncbi:ABC transporter permease [Mucilaginibacter flavidus]|uniref:ABC transporter permease n=1 Tax=Mucilaginibacter flavidus TaxID=2949309 RepID=UPI002091F2B7|nr:ABC transporter permease [Mucilaginibacter flavidus]MCO5949998.1 ABC transporter permease [Mucilaginibacter flavidus]